MNKYLKAIREFNAIRFSRDPRITYEHRKHAKIKIQSLMKKYQNSVNLSY